LVGTCTATKAAGEACIFSFGCQSELECSDDEVCAETPPECVVDADCSDGWTCEQGSCDFADEDSMCFDDAT
ncbi:MAG: hypothetical protein GY822_31795, partial [Deltaproteobacteria bacterium]|nr:hypothetical protein [Deltaproteobacteria bacterium]